MKALSALLGLALCSFHGASSHAQTSDDRFVVVLKRGTLPVDAWQPGMRAVVSELVARGYELVVRSSVAKDLGALQSELEFAASERATVGAVAVFRIAQNGTAYVYTPRTGLVQLCADGRAGMLAESDLALRVSELFRDPEIPRPREPQVTAAPAPASAPRPAKPPARRSRTAPPARDFGEVWLAAGAALSPALSGIPMVWLGANSPHWGAFALDLSFATSPLSSSIATMGSLDGELTLHKLGGHVVFDPWAQRAFGVQLALGGGVAWVQVDAESSSGLQGMEAETRVTSLSARASVFVRADSFRVLASVEPGFMLPALSVRAAGEEVARIGRPWSEFAIALAWQP